MGIATTQQLTRYYDQYRDTEIAFTKDIIKALSLDPRQVYIKCAGGQWPCIINSTSFQMARIIVGTKGGAYQALSAKEPPAANIRFCFYDSDKEMMSFLVAGRVEKVAPYMNSGDLAIVTIKFTTRPPDDLIELVGKLLDANANAIRRREERIVINEDSKRKLSIAKDETLIVIQNVPRHCILRDVSFSGAKIIILGLMQFLKDKDAVLVINFTEPAETVQIKGKLVGVEPIQDRKDICAVSMKFDEKLVPLAYKLHVNDYLTSVRKVQLSVQDQIAAQKAAQAEALKKQQEADKQGQEGLPSEISENLTADANPPAEEASPQL